MENASKALIIAGSILIAVLVISLVVAFYGNIRNIVATKNKTDTEKEIAEYNKYYDAFDRNDVNGIELYSLINKVYDYNKTQADNEGYVELELSVTFNNSVVKGTYSGSPLKDIFDERQIKVNDYTNNQYKAGRATINISKVASMRSNVRTEYLNELNITLDTKISSLNNMTVNDAINDYNEKKSELAILKSATFSASVFKFEDKTSGTSGFEYDDNTSRITSMKFVENKKE